MKQANQTCLVEQLITKVGTIRDCLLNYTESLDQMHASFWDRKKTVFALNCPNQGLRTIDFWKETPQLRLSILCLPCSSIIFEGRQRPLLPIPPQNKPNARRKILVWFELSFENMNICANQPQVIVTDTVYFMFFACVYLVTACAKWYSHSQTILGQFIFQALVSAR